MGRKRKNREGKKKEGKEKNKEIKGKKERRDRGGGKVRMERKIRKGEEAIALKANVIQTGGTK